MTIAELNAQGCAFQDAKEYDRAAEAFERALGLCPGRYEILWNLAKTERLRGNHEKALSFLERAKSANDADADAWALSGLILWEMKDEAGAERAFRTAIAMNAACGDAWNDYGVLEFNRGRLKQAREKFAKATELMPGAIDAWINLRDTCGELGDEKGKAECQARLDSLERH